MSVIKFRFLFGLYSFLILTVSGIPGIKLPEVWFPNEDKLFHFIEYSVLGILAVKSIQNPNWLKLPLILVYGILFAGLDEFWQSFIPNRCSSIYDFLFDVLGVGFGSMLILSTVKKHD